ncbi:glycosyl hydrolase [Cellulomonas soli]|uniref:glycosyl hydrolase n=1 Tax=Cellulomonas soli TaxID=931535 RepID=UPI003F83540F
MNRAPLVAAVATVLVAGGLVAALRPPWAGADAPGADLGGTGGSTAALTGDPPDARPPVLDAAALVDAVEHGSPGDLGPMRLADGMVPPTNRWFSGLVFGPAPQPVFALPGSFALTDAGWSLGLPVPVVSDAAVVGPHVPAVTLDVGAATSRVVAYDTASVTLEPLDASGEPLGRLVLAEGSPFVAFTAAGDLTLRSDVAFAGTGTADDPATAHVAGRTWALVATGPAGAVSGQQVALAAGQSATVYPLPDDADQRALDRLAQAAADPVTATALTYGVSELGVADGVARTTLRYTTARGTPTVVAAMPHHVAGGVGGTGQASECDLGTYPSVYGTLTLCPGTDLVTRVPALTPTAAPDIAQVDGPTRAALADQLRADVATTSAYPSDTYFGGKALYRSAMLVTLGRALGEDEAVAALSERVVGALREWTEPDGCRTRAARCFLYDETARGVVGLTPSFGSEEFNDHHFHYGYLLGAAGLMAADDPDLAADLAPVMDLLALDIAAGEPSAWFPALRVLDVYRGHSWASGTSPFADGNNQESTAEAISAWNGLGLWARASGQDDLATQAAWMLSTEAFSARAYWTEPDLGWLVDEGFGHRILAMSWGAKRDYATWFSAQPSAMLGIQLLPMPAVDGLFAADAEQVRSAVAEAAPAGFDVQFGDYLVMYLALVDPHAAATAAADLPDTAIDDADSRTYLLAWLAAPPARAR